MIKKFERIISTTQSKYKATLEKKSITQQCSYNLPNEMESYLKSINAINRVTPNGADTNVIYELNATYKMTLGDNILAIIGSEYGSKNNKVVFTHTEGANGGSQKLQLKKTDFSSRGNDYKWFVDLYEKNIELVNFVAFVDDVKKELKFDVELSKELFNVTNGDDFLIGEEYSKFKKLLGWFVNQLNVNNGLSSGNKTSGQGYKDGASIRDKYKEWRDYGSFTLDCNIISGYQSTFSKVNYINRTGTGINLRPRFDKETKKVVSLSIDLYKNAEELSDEVVSILNEEYQVSSLMLFDNAEPNDNLKKLFDNYCKIINMFAGEEEKDIATYDYLTSTINDGQNLIIYGTPGCGKSYYVEHTLLKDYPKENYIRTTFFQDYTNTDFVGQILPKVEGEKVTYEFNPGPFTLALEQAIRKPNERIALVIEELNRGSAASIFGDIFQLLDRKNGISEYSIMNVNVIHYLEEKFKGQYAFSNIKLPGNLSIFATMNTSDQNVFILDTAFKRRWKFKKLLNVFDSTHAFRSCYIPGANITWQEFVEGINAYILSVSNGLNSEDKQLGVYFVDEKGMRKDVNEVPDETVVDDFAYKVLEYLWADVAKFDRPKWFNEEIKCLDDLVKEYKKNGIGVFNNDVFNK